MQSHLLRLSATHLRILTSRRTYAMSNLEEQLSTLFYFLAFMLLWTILVSDMMRRLFKAVDQYLLQRAIIKVITKSMAKVSANLFFFFTTAYWEADSRRAWESETRPFLKECERREKVNTVNTRSSESQVFLSVGDDDL